MMISMKRFINKVSKEISVGDIILIPFPFTNLVSTKTRPALIIFEDCENTDDIIILAITSRKSHRNFYALDNSSLKIGQLPQTSYVLCSKVTTLHRGLIKKKVASLMDRHLRSILHCFVKQFFLT